MEWQDERLVELRMRADGRVGLFPLLRDALGRSVGPYRLERLLAAGRQAFVFLAIGPSGPVIVKQPAFDYRHPIRYDRQTVERMREALRREDAVLRSSPGGFFPKPMELLTAPPVVEAAERCYLFAESECFLVQEWLEGKSLRDLAFHDWRQQSLQAKETITRQLAGEFIAFWEGLREARWFYGDISPGNFLIETATGRMRVVDAGSVIPAEEWVVLAGVTPAFTTPRILEAFRAQRLLRGSLASVLPGFAKVLHFVLTLREPLNGVIPALNSPEFDEISSDCREALSAAFALDAAPDELESARRAWLRFATSS